MRGWALPATASAPLLATEKPSPKVISDLSERRSKSSWHTHAGDFGAELTTPLGFGLRLQVEPH